MKGLQLIKNIDLGKDGEPAVIQEALYDEVSGTVFMLKPKYVYGSFEWKLSNPEELT